MERVPEAEFLLTTMRGTWWSYVARFGGKPFAVLGTLILVRLLSKEDFGTAAFALTSIGFLAPLSDFGIGAALIYHRDDPDTATTAFWLGLAIGFALYAGVWIAAPLVGAVFHDPWAVTATRVLALTIPLSALGQIHESMLQKRLSFRGQVPPTLVRTVSKSVLAVILAAAGFGPWSLIWSQVLSVGLWLVSYWWVLPWRPQFRFSGPRALAMLSYGRQMVIVGLVASLLVNVDFFFIGSQLGAAMLGLYTVGFRLPELLIIQLCALVSKVLFPVYVRITAEAGVLGRSFLQSVRYLALVTVPLGVGMALVAKPLVLSLYGAAWSDAVPVVQAISLYAASAVLERQTSSLLKATGQIAVLFRLTLARAVVLVPALWWAVSVPGSISAVAWTYAALGIAGSVVYLVVAGTTLALDPRAMLAALLPTSVCSALMALAVAVVLYGSAIEQPVLQLGLAVAAGVAVYGAASYWLQRDVVAQFRRLFGAARTSIP